MTFTLRHTLTFIMITHINTLKRFGFSKPSHDNCFLWGSGVCVCVCVWEGGDCCFTEGRGICCCCCCCCTTVLAVVCHTISHEGSLNQNNNQRCSSYSLPFKGNVTVRTVVDRFSEMVHFIPLPTLPLAKATAEVMLHRIFCL